MPVPTLVYRIEKGAPITPGEADGNLKILRDFSNTLESLIAVVVNPGTGQIVPSAIGVTDGAITAPKLADGAVIGAKVGATAAGVVASGRNILAQNDDTAPDTLLTITADELLLKDINNRPYLALAVNVNADLTVSGAGGLDTGSEAPSTWYYFWVIWNGTNLKGLLSASLATPNLPVNYTHKALIGAVRNDGSGNLTRFWQSDRQVWINQAEVFALHAGPASYASQDIGNLVPPIAKLARGTMGSTNGGWGMKVAGDGNGLGACSGSNANTGGGSVDGTIPLGNWSVPMKTPQTVYWKTSVTSSVFQLAVSGYAI